MPAVFNAANEVAVARFVDGKIGFTQIFETVEKVMRAHRADRTAGRGLHRLRWMLYWKQTFGRERKQNMPFDTIIDEIISICIYPALLVVFFFGLTIFIHELGHFLMAKRRGMKIERFSIGFGPQIGSWKRDGVEYRISWIPFGGYVALPQMAPMEVIEGKTESKPEELPPASPESKTLVAFLAP